MLSDTKVKEHPIIFTGENVRAILEGRKTQTRRIVRKKDVTIASIASCPYVPGDHLWVRETFIFWKGNDVRESYIGTDMKPVLGPPPHYKYRASEPNCVKDSIGKAMFKWRPAIFMPRNASRLTLEITDVRIERLRDISEEDALAEGINLDSPAEREWTGTRKSNDCHRGRFVMLWDSINRRHHPWASNPWVWAITFKKLEGPCLTISCK